MVLTNGPGSPSADAGGVLSKECEAVLRGSAFDARCFLKRGRPTGDPLVDEEQERLFKSKLRVLDMLNRFPEHVLTFQQRLSDEVQGLVGQKVAKLDDMFDKKTTRRFAKVPIAWKASYLTRVIPDGGFTATEAMLVDSKNADSTAQMFDYLHGITGDSWFPEEALDKVVAERMLSKRFASIGRYNIG